MAVVAERLGVLAPPRSHAELRSTLRGFRGELAVNHQTREGVRFLLAPPTPLVVRPAYAVICGAAVSLLPRYARRMLWLPVAPGAEPILVRPTATALVRAVGWAMQSRLPEVVSA
jgi:uncharacterized protein (DUF2236 family)